MPIPDIPEKSIAWGIALLAAYMLKKAENNSLEAYLNEKVLASEAAATLNPDPEDVRGFAAFMDRYKKGFIIEKTAVDVLK